MFSQEEKYFFFQRQITCMPQYLIEVLWIEEMLHCTCATDPWTKSPVAASKERWPRANAVWQRWCRQNWNCCSHSSISIILTAGKISTLQPTYRKGEWRNIKAELPLCSNQTHPCQKVLPWKPSQYDNSWSTAVTSVSLSGKLYLAVKAGGRSAGKSWGLLCMYTKCLCT